MITSSVRRWPAAAAGPAARPVSPGRTWVQRLGLKEHRPARPAKYFQVARPQADHLHLQLVLHDVVDGLRDADAAGLRLGLQACRDVDAVAHHILVLHEHVAEVDADAMLQRRAGGDVLRLGGKLTLHGQRASHGLDRAGEREQEAIARRFQ